MEVFQELAGYWAFLTRTLRASSVDPDDVITSVHADSEKDSELAVEVSSWRSERAQRAQRVPGRGVSTSGRRCDERKQEAGAFSMDSFMRARACCGCKERER